jgi:hypothetical protein
VFWLHGTPGSRLLRHFDGSYERIGARVITYDAFAVAWSTTASLWRGHGDSTWPTSPRRRGDAATRIMVACDDEDPQRVDPGNGPVRLPAPR